MKNKTSTPSSMHTTIATTTTNSNVAINLTQNQQANNVALRKHQSLCMGKNNIYKNLVKMFQQFYIHLIIDISKSHANSKSHTLCLCVQLGNFSLDFEVFVSTKRGNQSNLIRTNMMPNVLPYSIFSLFILLENLKKKKNNHYHEPDANLMSFDSELALARQRERKR